MAEIRGVDGEVLFIGGSVPRVAPIGNRGSGLASTAARAVPCDRFQCVPGPPPAPSVHLYPCPSAVDEILVSFALTSYAGAQAVLMTAFLLLPPGTWLTTAVQISSGWLGVAVILRASGNVPAGRRGIWFLFAAGLFFNSSGILVEKILERFFAAPPSPTVADLFYLLLYPFLVTGLCSPVYRRSGEEDTGGVLASTAISTVITVGMALVAWELVVVPQAVLKEVSTARMLVITAYPLGDLVLIALALRLLFSGGLGSPAFGMMFLSIICFLVADTGWVLFHGADRPLGQAFHHGLAATSLAAFAFLGAAAGHHSFVELVRPAAKDAPPSSAVIGALAVTLLAAPAVLAIEAVVDRLYGAGGR
jgi:diguanylate cyclase